MQNKDQLFELIDVHFIEYEEGFLATCESRFDRLPDPICPYQADSGQAKAWAFGVVRAVEILECLNLDAQPEVF